MKNIIRVLFGIPVVLSIQPTIQPTKQPIDILFYGSLTDDRIKILSNIFNGTSSSERLAIIFNFDGEKLDEYISRAKIIVDLQTNIEVPNIQKQTRIFYALINGKCVVSEKSRRNY